MNLIKLLNILTRNKKSALEIKAAVGRYGFAPDAGALLFTKGNVDNICKEDNRFKHKSNYRWVDVRRKIKFE